MYLHVLDASMMKMVGGASENDNRVITIITVKGVESCKYGEAEFVC